jgi:hypothetical protein
MAGNAGVHILAAKPLFAPGAMCPHGPNPRISCAIGRGRCRPGSRTVGATTYASSPAAERASGHRAIFLGNVMAHPWPRACWLRAGVRCIQDRGFFPADVVLPARTLCRTVFFRRKTAAHAYTARRTISSLILLIAPAGFRPFGHTSTQFMIVWQRKSRYGSSRLSRRSAVPWSRLSAMKR